MSLIDTCIRQEDLTISQMATMCEAARISGHIDVRMTDLEPHQNGYFAAQAAGFALIAEIERMRESLQGIPLYRHDRLTGEIVDNDEWFDLEIATNAIAMSPGALHAARIVDAQQRTDIISDIVRRGAANLRLWCSLDDEGRYQVLRDSCHEFVEEEQAHLPAIAA